MAYRRRDSNHAPFPWRGELEPPDDDIAGDRTIIDRSRSCLRFLRGQHQAQLQQAFREVWRGFLHILAASLGVSESKLSLTDLGSEPKFHSHALASVTNQSLARRQMKMRMMQQMLVPQLAQMFQGHPC